jgi:hypothetical protein
MKSVIRGALLLAQNLSSLDYTPLFADTPPGPGWWVRVSLAVAISVFGTLDQSGKGR